MQKIVHTAKLMSDNGMRKSPKELAVSPGRTDLAFLYFALSLSNIQMSAVVRVTMSSSTAADPAVTTDKMSHPMTLSASGSPGVVAAPNFEISQSKYKQKEHMYY